MRASALAAAFLGDEQTGDLTLRPRRHHDRARLRQRLCTSGLNFRRS